MGEIVRLQKYIAMSGVASRRAAEKMITEGRVKVNGKKVTEQGVKVETGADSVSVDGKAIGITEKKYYIMLNKPEGYVSSAKDQFDRPTVVDLVKNEIDTRIFPVGRLDYDTTGLLLMTNDGDFTYKITHPSFEKAKTYVALISGKVTEKALDILRRGVVIDGYKTSPAKIEMIGSENGKVAVKVTIHEGRNRQVRRMFENVGLKVSELKRIQIGEVSLGNLPEGRWRYLTSHEISCLIDG